MSGSNNLGFSPVYKAFHTWLSVYRNTIAAPKDRTVIYSGWDCKGVPNWSKLDGYAKQLKAKFGVDPKWKTIQDVLEGLPFNLDDYLEDSRSALNGAKFGTMWDFAVGAKRNKLVSDGESQQIWFNFSVFYNKNAKGDVWMWVGDTLKEFPDLLLAEIPILLKNKKISEDSMKRAIQLVPKSAEVWSKYLKAQPSARMAGRS